MHDTDDAALSVGTQTGPDEHLSRPEHLNGTPHLLHAAHATSRSQHAACKSAMVERIWAELSEPRAGCAVVTELRVPTK